MASESAAVVQAVGLEVFIVQVNSLRSPTWTPVDERGGTVPYQFNERVLTQQQRFVSSILRMLVGPSVREVPLMELMMILGNDAEIATRGGKVIFVTNVAKEYLEELTRVWAAREHGDVSIWVISHEGEELVKRRLGEKLKQIPQAT